MESTIQNDILPKLKRGVFNKKDVVQKSLHAQPMGYNIGFFANKIISLFNESIDVKKKSRDFIISDINSSAELIINAFKNGKKVLVCGNGGSAADAQHFVAELIMRFEKNRAPLPAIALTTDSSVLTACSNDFGYECVFEKQVQALGQEGDVFIGISTSGNSPNVINAVKVAKQKNIKTVLFLGKDGGKLKNMACDSNIIVPSNITARIQEVHITIIHILCNLIESELFKEE